MMRIEDAVFVVVDTETTGSSEHDRIIEIGAVKLRGGQILGRFSRLVNPGRAIPYAITRLTGITTSMVFDAPPMEEVMPEFLAFLEGGVFVAHNLSFDWRMLAQEAHRLGLALPSVDTLCTLRLARRVLPGLPSKGLKALCAHFGVPLVQHHRALDDAEATAQVLLHLIQHARATVQIRQLEELIRYQHRTYRRAGAEPRHIQRIREHVLPQIPTSPGVYFFKDGRGNLLYIGKARQLQARVMHYFNGLPAQEERIQRLMRATRSISWKEVPTELDALLLESRLIKQHRPRFNRAQKRYRQYAFLRLGMQDRFPALSLSPVIRYDGAEYFGPFPNRKQAERVLALAQRLYRLRECSLTQLKQGRICPYASMDRCLAPCVSPENAAYDREVARVRAFLTGQVPHVLREVERAMKAAADRLAYEEAHYYKTQLEALNRMLERQRVLAHPVSHLHGLVLHTVQGREVELAGVYAGRPLFTWRGCLPLTAESRETIERRVFHHFGKASACPSGYVTREGVDEIRILAHWMFVHRENILLLRWSEDQSLKAWWEEIAEQLHHQWEEMHVE